MSSCWCTVVGQAAKLMDVEVSHCITRDYQPPWSWYQIKILNLGTSLYYVIIRDKKCLIIQKSKTLKSSIAKYSNKIVF